MELKVTNSKELAKHKVTTFVVFVATDDKDGKSLRFDSSLGAQSAVDAKHIQALVNDVHDSGKFKGAAKETVLFRNVLGTGDGASGLKHLLLVGLGKSKSVNSQSVRVAGSVLAKTLVREKILSAAFNLKSASKFGKPAELGEELAEGSLLGVYKFDELKSKKKTKDDKKSEATTTEEKTTLWAVADDKTSNAAFQKAVQSGEALAEATNFARTLGNRPGNVCTPTHLAEATRDAAKGLNVKVTIWGKKEIEKHHMGCFLAVNQASGEEPRFIIMEYNGGKKSDRPFVMVGKGLTFDTGGISIKPSASMEEMKFDMCGGAAVIGAMLAIARLKLKVNVVTLVPSTDNMPGGKAIKPGDIVTASNGKTVEINNTDAEGRLILADALVYACSLKPKAIIDAATLTGACQVALGNVFTGVFTRDEKFLKKIETAADRSGERVWQLPLTDDYVDDMKGTYGDLSNMAFTKGGGASHGAAFLDQFVEEGTTWAHFDIAATAWNAASRSALNPDKGATGVAVRMFTRLAELMD